MVHRSAMFECVETDVMFSTFQLKQFVLHITTLTFWHYVHVLLSLDSAFGGPQSHDYCAFREPTVHNVYTDFESNCMDTRGNVYGASNDYPSARFAVNSRCVEMNDGNSKMGHCFQHECTRYDGIHRVYNAVNIQLSDGKVDKKEVITCTRSDALRWKMSNQYSVSIKCPDIDVICGQSTKPFRCFWGHFDDDLGKCLCSAGYTGDDCSVQDTNAVVAELANDRSVRINMVRSRTFDDGTGICITNSVLNLLNGYYSFNMMPYEGLPSFRGTQNGKSLYFLRYFSQWNVANNAGDTSIFAYCVHPLSTDPLTDITECTQWVVWDDGVGWMVDVGINVYRCILRL